MNLTEFMNLTDPVYVIVQSTNEKREGYYSSRFMCSNCHHSEFILVKKGYKTEQAKVKCPTCGCDDTMHAGKVGFL